MMIEQNTNYAYKLKYKPTLARICASIAMRMRARKRLLRITENTKRILWVKQFAHNLARFQKEQLSCIHLQKVSILPFLKIR